MVFTIFTFILAALGLSFLVFIHELGHYFVARRKHMRVEVFSIGFGKPIYKWKRGDVQWQICYLLFGGYVKIAGMERKDNVEPYQIPDGFYAKKPLDRIKVALAGPIVNIVFAIVCFTAIWGLGGRQKTFSEFTSFIGWIDPKSELYDEGIRPGDEIVTLNGRKFTGFKDLLYSYVMRNKKGTIQGYKIDYQTNEKSPFYLSLDRYEEPRALNESFLTIGIVSPARYLYYDRYPGGGENPLAEGSPMRESGIEYGDRIVWADGEVLFSVDQLKSLINQPRSLLTIRRDGEIFLQRVPRVKIRDIRQIDKYELDDWQHVANLGGSITQRYFIPFNLTSDLVVESELPFIDEQSEEVMASAKNLSLKPGDRILAVDGRPVANAMELLANLQDRKVQMIVQRKPKGKVISWRLADQQFEHSVNWPELYQFSRQVGVLGAAKQQGDFVMLNPVSPVTYEQIPMRPGVREALANQYGEERKQIDKIESKQKREEAIKLHAESQSRLLLNIQLQDRAVQYNPSPFTIFGNVLEETWLTLSSLISGDISPKYLSGPVGIVHVMKYSWTIGFKEALYWLGLISLNLGILNLLPIPVLDGGHICFSLYEAITKRRIRAKTMERMIIPFVILLIAFFFYVTYHDIIRLFT